MCGGGWAQGQFSTYSSGGGAYASPTGGKGYTTIRPVMEANDSRDLGNWLQGFLPWEVPDGLYTTIAPNFFAIVHDLTSRYPKSDEVALSRGAAGR